MPHPKGMSKTLKMYPFPNLHVSQLGGQLFVLGSQHFDLLLQLRILLRTILHPLLQRFNVVLGEVQK
jgi:hypothetical protein